MGLIKSNQSWASFSRCILRCNHYINIEPLNRFNFSPFSSTPHLYHNLTLKTQALKSPFDRCIYIKLTDIACKVFGNVLKVA